MSPAALQSFSLSLAAPQVPWALPLPLVSDHLEFQLQLIGQQSCREAAGCRVAGTGGNLITFTPWVLHDVLFFLLVHTVPLCSGWAPTFVIFQIFWVEVTSKVLCQPAPINQPDAVGGATPVGVIWSWVRRSLRSNDTSLTSNNLCVSLHGSHPALVFLLSFLSCSAKALAAPTPQAAASLPALLLSLRFTHLCFCSLLSRE